MKLIKTVAGYVALVLLLNCAHTGIPEGGPADESPPDIVHTVPDTGAVNVSVKVKPVTY